MFHFATEGRRWRSRMTDTDRLKHWNRYVKIFCNIFPLKFNCKNSLCFNYLVFLVSLKATWYTSVESTVPVVGLTSYVHSVNDQSFPKVGSTYSKMEIKTAFICRVLPEVSVDPQLTLPTTSGSFKVVFLHVKVIPRKQNLNVPLSLH